MSSKNAIIMAAGTSSRFVPLSAEIPKGLLDVRGEIMIERQIRQLKEAGISDIIIVVGYMADKFCYLKEKFGVEIVYNSDFDRYNNTSSVIRVLDRLGDTYICSSDNYFPFNVFNESVEQSYYSALYEDGETEEYCITANSDNIITNVTIGGRSSWYMVGHVYFSRAFSLAFKELLLKEYEKEEVKHGYWEDVFIKHIKELPPMHIKRYDKHDIEEFDSIDELRQFDKSYLCNTRSSVLRDIARRLECGEDRLDSFAKIPGHNKDHLMFGFHKDGDRYRYDGKADTITRI